MVTGPRRSSCRTASGALVGSVERSTAVGIQTPARETSRSPGPRGRPRRPTRLDLGSRAGASRFRALPGSAAHRRSPPRVSRGRCVPASRAPGPDSHHPRARAPRRGESAVRFGVEGTARCTSPMRTRWSGRTRGAREEAVSFAPDPRRLLAGRDARDLDRARDRAAARARARGERLSGRSARRRAVTARRRPLRAR
jgi:hypothetical protein